MIRGQTRPLPVAAGITPESQCINAKFNASIHNRFDIEVIDAETGEIKQKAQAENVICTNYWKYLFYSQSTYIYYICFGSGEGIPSESDTTLFSFLGSGFMGSKRNTKIDDETYSFRGGIQLSETVAVGETITEVGLSPSNSNAIVTHAMLKDMNGNQIGIAKTDTDIINIYATVFLHIPSSALKGITFTEVNPEKEYDFFRAIAGLGIYLRPTAFSWQTRVYNTAGNTQNLSAFTQTTNPTSANKAVSFIIPRIAVGSGNLAGGISEIEIVGYYGSMEQIISIPVTSEWYPGSNIVGESIGTGDGTTTAFATDFVHATNATIYVNGVAQSGVTVTDASTVTNNIVFTTAPASGAVITADYHTSVIAKDVNHVFDFSVTFNFGEYSA